VSTLYDRALNYLALRARSTAELRRRLLDKGADSADVEQVLDRLTQQGLLNDTDFARQFARTKLLTAGASRFRIARELTRKGVSREVADRAVQTLVEEEGVDPSAAIRRVAEKKWRTLAGLDDATARRRLYAFLARRGFNPDEIRSVMHSITDTADAAEH
jgi:regulatory protein